MFKGTGLFPVLLASDRQAASRIREAVMSNRPPHPEVNAYAPVRVGRIPTPEREGSPWLLAFAGSKMLEH